MTKKKKIPRFLMPLVWVGDLLGWILNLTGRLIAALLGMTFLGVGLLLTLTLVAAPLGVPLAIFGFLLILRSLF